MKMVKLKGVTHDFYVNPDHVVTVSTPERDGSVLVGHAMISTLNMMNLLAAQSPAEVADLLSPARVPQVLN